MWAFYALLSSFTQSATRLSNQFFKLKGLDLTFAIKVVQALLVSPFLFFVPWPTDPWFYVFVCATAPLIVYHDKSFFDFTSRFGAGTVTRIEPLTVLFVFIAWFCLHPSLLFERMEKPILFAGVILCLVIGAFFAIRMRRHPVNAETLRFMMPLIFVTGGIYILAKSGVDLLPDGSGIAVYLFIQSVLVAFLSFLWGKGFPDKASFKIRKFYVVSISLAALALCGMAARLLAYRAVENPAYVTALMLTAPFWTMLVNKLCSYPEEGDVANGIGIVFSAIILTVLTSFF